MIQEGGLEEDEIKNDAVKRKERKTMTVGMTKLGITLCISAVDCEKLGIPPTTTTREAIKIIKQKLGLDGQN